MVVSGSHVVFLESLLFSLAARWPAMRHLQLPVLIAFALANRLDAIVIRAVSQRLLAQLSSRFQLGWTSLQCLAGSGLTAIGFCQGRPALLSLSMSWILCLALIEPRFPRDVEDKTPARPKLNRALNTNLRAYILIAPALLPLALPHPLSIVFNLLVSPIIGLILFPAALLAFLFPWLVPFCDRLWIVFTRLVSDLAERVPAAFAPCPLPTWALILYLTALMATALWQERTGR